MVSIGPILSNHSSFVTHYLGNPGYRLRSLAGKPHLSDNLEQPNLPFYPRPLRRYKACSYEPVFCHLMFGFVESFEFSAYLLSALRTSSFNIPCSIFYILLFSPIRPPSSVFRPGVYPRCRLLCFSAGGLPSSVVSFQSVFQRVSVNQCSKLRYLSQTNKMLISKKC